MQTKQNYYSDSAEILTGTMYVICTIVLMIVALWGAEAPRCFYVCNLNRHICILSAYKLFIPRILYYHISATPFSFLFSASH